MIDFKKVIKLPTAIYINFPFCKLPCSFCHYLPNNSYHYNYIPDEYFRLLIIQLESVLKDIFGASLDSIYFGGGTPSLLNDAQCEHIKKLFKLYCIDSKEISIEIYPNLCNFDYVNNDFFTRYSLGIQFFDQEQKQKYNRNNYCLDDIKHIVENIKKSKHKKNINIDLLFNDVLYKQDVLQINSLEPNMVTFYPNTKGRGYKRLYNILRSFETIKNFLKNYNSLGKSKFIFVRNDSSNCYYAKLEYEKFGNIIGIGHNSLSYIYDKTFLCKYNNDNTFNLLELKRKDNRYLTYLVKGISTGVLYKYIKNFLPKSIEKKFFLLTKNDENLLDKHINVLDDDLVYLPETEYFRFYEFLLQNFNKEISDEFLLSIGYGDKDIETNKKIYNEYVLLNDYEYLKLQNITQTKSLRKIITPTFRILVEGIDGSGKDTFVKILSEELKRRFKYDKDSRISITGEPNSKLDFGVEAKKFIEYIDFFGDNNYVKDILIKNRISDEKQLIKLPGIVIVIRGFVTDKATFFRVFNNDEYLGEGEIIKQWDKYIVVDIDPHEANSRISKRGIPRTWRETIENLEYFRNFYLTYNNKIFKNKEIIYNDNIKYLHEKSIDIANEIYSIGLFNG